MTIQDNKPKRPLDQAFEGMGSIMYKLRIRVRVTFADLRSIVHSSAGQSALCSNCHPVRITFRVTARIRVGLEFGLGLGLGLRLDLDLGLGIGLELLLG